MTNQRLMQAYQQAPWRIQTQRIAMFLLVLIAVGVTAGLYLNISAKAATAAIEIRTYENMRDTIQEENANLEAELAVINNSENLKKRAQDLGYQPVDTYAMQFLIIPEYPGRQPAMMAPPPGVLRSAQPLLRELYTQSLWDWFLESMSAAGGDNG